MTQPTADTTEPQPADDVGWFDACDCPDCRPVPDTPTSGGTHAHCTCF